MGAGLQKGLLCCLGPPLQVPSIQHTEPRLRQADQVPCLRDTDGPDACVEALLDVGNGIADLDDRCQTTDTERLHQAEDHPRGGPALGDVGRSRGVRHEAALGSLSKRVGIAVASAGAGALQ